MHLGGKNIHFCKKSSELQVVIVTPPLGLESYTSLACISEENGERKTNHWPYGSWQTPPIPVPEASIASSQFE